MAGSCRCPDVYPGVCGVSAISLLILTHRWKKKKPPNKRNATHRTAQHSPGREKRQVTDRFGTVFGSFRMVSDRFGRFSDRFGSFRTVFGSFRTVFGSFRTSQFSFFKFQISIGQGWGPVEPSRAGEPSRAPALANCNLKFD